MNFISEANSPVWEGLPNLVRLGFDAGRFGSSTDCASTTARTRMKRDTRRVFTAPHSTT